MVVTARLDIHLQDQLDIGHEVSVIGMGRTPQFVRVVTHLGILRIIVERLHGDINFLYPGGDRKGRISGM
jgi:hypothetical protein